VDINWLNFITWKKPIDQQHRRHSRINCRVILAFSHSISLVLSQSWFPVLCRWTLCISLWFSLHIAGEQQFRCVYTIVSSPISFYSSHYFIFIHYIGAKFFHRRNRCRHTSANIGCFTLLSQIRTIVDSLWPNENWMLGKIRSFFCAPP